MIKIQVEQGSEAWHSLRLGRFTASKFKSLMSGETTEGYKDVILDVVGEILSGEAEDSYSSPDMIRGTELEPEARAYFEHSKEVEVEQVGFCLPDDEELAEWVGVSPDGILPDGGLLEIKCPKLKTHLKYLEAGRLPNEYKWQVQGQLLVTGAPYCVFISYYPDFPAFELRVEPDAEMHQQLMARFRVAIGVAKEKLEFYRNLKNE